MSGIEWTDKTWNPIRGCSPVSAGCLNCWAARQANRQSGYRKGKPLCGGAILHEKTKGAYHGFVKDGRWTGRVEPIPGQLDKPQHWRQPRRVAVALMGDLFHEALTLADITTVLNVARLAPQHDYQILTKRPERMRDILLAIESTLPGEHPEWWPLPNVWLGVSVENQATADERIPLLLETPAAVRWVSYEPALGPVDFGGPLNGYPRWVSSREYVTREMALDAGRPEMEGSLYSDDEWEQTMLPIDWLVIGGESGPGARPCDVEWIRSAVRQCQDARVPVFVKQDSGPRPGQQGRIPDELWIKEFP